jgi:hypothetical protein
MFGTRLTPAGEEGAGHRHSPTCWDAQVLPDRRSKPLQASALVSVAAGCECCPLGRAYTQ